MATEAEWIALQKLPPWRAEVKSCSFWPHRQQANTRSFRALGGTRIKIAIGGSDSSEFHEGLCDGGGWLDSANVRFDSANALVAEIRKNLTVSSNAYLYVTFRIGATWHKADDVRRDQRLSVDPFDELVWKEAESYAEERLLESSLKKKVQDLRARKGIGDDVSDVELLLLEREPQFLEVAQKVVRTRQSTLASN